MPNSVLWVFLIVVWLFVLVPMVLRGRPEARKSTAAAAQTRVVHRGGSRSAAARRRAAQARAERAEGLAKRLAESTAADAEDEVADEPEVLDAEIVDDPVTNSTSTADSDETAANDDDIVDAEVDESDADDVVSDDAAVDEDAAEAEADEPVVLRAEAESPLEVTDVFEPVDVDDVVDIDEAQAARADTVTPHDDEDDDESDSDAAFDILDDEDDYDETDYDETDEVDDDPAPTPREMRGTGGYGPGLAQAREDAAYRERRRVLAGLALLTLGAIVSAFFVQPLGFVAVGVMVVVSALYLVFLRRAVRAEQARHAQRMARQRRRQAEEERVQRVQSEPGYVAPPARLRRPGGAIVLEIDDEDPAFEHLPTYDFAYREEYDSDSEYEGVVHRTAV